MKTIKYILVIGVTILMSYSLKAQSKTHDQKVSIYTSEEKDNMQIWLDNAINKMELSQSVRNEYYHVLLSYVYDMGRLDDRDKNFSEGEIQKRLKLLIEKMDIKMQQILTKTQFEKHKANFNVILRSIYKKRHWSND